MPCGCTKARKGSQWTYTAPSGVKQTYGTEVEAKAAQIRAGGGGTVSAK